MAHKIFCCLTLPKCCLPRFSKSFVCPSKTSKVSYIACRLNPLYSLDPCGKTTAVFEIDKKVGHLQGRLETE